MNIKFMNKVLYASIASAMMLPGNSLANFNNPFGDEEEQPLLFGDYDDNESNQSKKTAIKESKPVQPAKVPLNAPSKVQPISKAPIPPQVITYSSSGSADAKKKLEQIRKDAELAKKAAVEKESEVKRLEADLERQAILEDQEARRIQAQKEREAKAALDRQRTAELNKARMEKERIEREYQEKQAREREEARLKVIADRAAKNKLAAERLAQIKAETEAKLRAQQEEKARLAAEREAKAKLQAEMQLQAKREAEEKAKHIAEENAKKAAEEKARLEVAENARKVAAERARFEAERIAREKEEAKLKAAIEADRILKAKQEADRKAQEKALQEAERVAKQKRDAEKSNAPAVKLPAKTSSLSSATQFGTIPTQPVTTGAYIGPTYANRATQSALQKATSKIAINPADMPIRNRVLGFTANEAQIESLNNRYKYDPSRMSVMPKQVGDIRLLNTARLTGDTIAIFNTTADKQIVEEYLSYHPLHAQVFSNYVKRVMTMNGGATGGISIDKALMEELTYNFATTPIRSASLSNAQDQYLYITSRLNDADQIKFWNWVNTVKTADEIKVPAWISLADAMFSQ